MRHTSNLWGGGAEGAGGVERVHRRGSGWSCTSHSNRGGGRGWLAHLHSLWHKLEQAYVRVCVGCAGVFIFNGGARA